MSYRISRRVGVHPRVRRVLVGGESKEVVASYDRIEHAQIDGEVEVERGGGICHCQKENRSSDETVLEETHLFFVTFALFSLFEYLPCFSQGEEGRADRLLALSPQPNKAR